MASKAKKAAFTPAFGELPPQVEQKLPTSRTFFKEGTEGRKEGAYPVLRILTPSADSKFDKSFCLFTSAFRFNIYENDVRYEFMQDLLERSVDQGDLLRVVYDEASLQYATLVIEPAKAQWRVTDKEKFSIYAATQI